NNPLERRNSEIRRRTSVVGNFPDGHSALMLVAARLRYLSGRKWGPERYLNMKTFGELNEKEIANRLGHSLCEIFWTLPFLQFQSDFLRERIFVPWGHHGQNLFSAISQWF
ncbi:MAG: transposase, partial [Desulfovibrionaceae bacterium]|nr:transposase [Desulfovibrionaceae bacterium]